MGMHIPAPVFGAADVSAASNAMAEIVRPLMLTLSGIAGLICVFFLVQGGIAYMSSTGRPDKLEQAKRILRNALVGLVIVLAATTLTNILTSAYSSTTPSVVQNIPSLTPVETDSSGGGVVDVLIKAIVGLFKKIIETGAQPFITALDYFTKATPLMGENSAVLQMWAVIVGLADVLFVLVIALLGFHIMSAEALGIDEIDFKRMIPQLSLTFLLMNTSLFAIDAVISLSNGMITAINKAFGGVTVWSTLSGVASEAGGLGLVALMIMVVFLILSVILLVYYVMRVVILYLGAALSPLVVLLYAVPAFKDFAATAIKSYVTNIFVLFVHVVILLMAASIFEGLKAGQSETVGTNSVMAIIVGIATILILLRTQSSMQQWSYASIGPRHMRSMSKQFMHGVSSTAGKVRSSRKSPEVPKVVILKTSKVKVREAK